MIIVAFLQNMWVKNPDNVKRMLDRWKDDPDFWNKTCRNLLFMGCKTGRVIKQVFGEDLAYSIIYDECTKEIAGDAKRVCKPDPCHIEATLNRLKPDVVITFGKIAYSAVFDVIYGSKGKFKPFLLPSPHPAARQPDTISKLRNVSKHLLKFINQNS